MNEYKITIDPVPDYLSIDKNGNYIVPNVKVKSHYYPEDWRPVLGEYNKPKAYYMNHQNTYGSGAKQVWWMTDSCWFKTKEEANKFIEANNIDVQPFGSYNHTKRQSSDGWLKDYI